MVTLEELAIIIPLVTSIIIPVIVVVITRYIKTADSLTRNTTLTGEAVKDLEGYVTNHKRETREIWNRIEALDKALFNMCWRVDRMEKEHDRARLE